MKITITTIITLLVAASSIQAQDLGGRDREVETKRKGVDLQVPFPHLSMLDPEQQSQLSKYREAADLANRCAEQPPGHVGCVDTGWVLAVQARKLGSKLSKTFPRKKQRTPEQAQQWAWIRGIQTQLVQVEQRAMLVRGNTGRGL